MASYPDQKPPSLWRIAGIRPLWLVIGLILVVLVVVGRNWATRRYEEGQQRHLLEQARTFEREGDIRSALLSLRRVLQLDPQNIEAIRMLATHADRVNSPSALPWMRRLAELEPQNVDNLVLWARCALRQGELIAADEVLQRFPPDQRESLSFHRLAGALAVQIRNYPAAEFHFAKASKLNPDAPQEQLNLASIRLLSSRPEIVRQSRETLERLTKHPELGREAALALLADHLRRNDKAGQLDLARKIMLMPHARFTDRITWLELLRRHKDARFASELDAAKDIARKNTSHAAELVAWMNARDMATEAYAWAASLPAKELTIPALALAVAESQAKLGKWAELHTATTKTDWAELDFLRLAFLARAQRELDLWGLSRSSWRQALAAAGLDPQSRSMLARVAQGWKWNSEAEEIWWALARGTAGRVPALKALHRLYREAGDSQQLLRVTELTLQLLPEDPVIKNNYAMLSLLLGKNLTKAHDLARANFEAHPSDPAAVSTRAFSLRQLGQIKEAVAVMDQLPPETRKIPAVAAYWGILLADSDRKKEASVFLDLGAGAEGLLPEERELLNQARAKVAE